MKRVIQSRPVRFVLDMLDLYFNKHVSRAAAELAYFLILSFFPVLICVNAIIGTLDLDVAALLENAAIIIPEAALTVLTEYVGYISTNQSGALLVGGVIMMLFSASAAMRSLMNVMDEIYDRKSYTGLWQIVASVVFSVLFLFTIYLSVVVVLTGNWFFHLLEEFIHHFPRLAHLTLPWEWQWMRFLILFCLVMIFVMVVYRSTAPRVKPRPPVLLGAFLTSAALVLSSILFSYFIGLSSRYSLVYGSLASVVILLVWLYLCGTIVILGSCFNRVWYSRKKEKKKI
ncbi:MAG: YihY/virulence factor BrkB family protein [Oscillospiraceae bacterium]|nr:YihY/virulence factor BrkB family protein [Oscillospiraceae bacterium]